MPEGTEKEKYLVFKKEIMKKKGNWIWRLKKEQRAAVGGTTTRRECGLGNPMLSLGILCLSLTYDIQHGHI